MRRIELKSKQKDGHPPPRTAGENGETFCSCINLSLNKFNSVSIINCDVLWVFHILIFFILSLRSFLFRQRCFWVRLHPDSTSCMPAFLTKAATNKSEQPLITSGWLPKSTVHHAEYTLMMRLTLDNSPISSFNSSYHLDGSQGLHTFVYGQIFTKVFLWRGFRQVDLGPFPKV